MCGVFGAVNLSGAGLRSPAAVRRMGEFLHHRGPDSHGLRESQTAVLGSRRLAIIDLSDEAIQPFSSPDDDVWLVCNGEIYNAPELREHYSAEGYPFRSDHNDVETILPLYLEHGADAVNHLEGMFGLAIYDMRSDRLLLARDRAGEKPLFFREQEGEFQFASEIQSLLSLDDGRPEVSREGLVDYLTLGYCLAPGTAFAGIRKLEAGQLLILDRSGMHSSTYWDAPKIAVEERPWTPHEIFTALERAVKRQMLSDVPLGLFLSGGVDSSVLTSEVVRHLPAHTVNTYSVAFESASFDESDWATRVAKKLGTRHHRVEGTDKELQRAMDVVTDGLAEPLGDPAIMPTYLLAEAARRDVKVIMSGEGADELFGGYPTYLGHRWARRFARLPLAVRGAITKLVESVPVSTRNMTLGFMAKRFIAEAERDAYERHVAWFGVLGAEAPSVVGLDVEPRATTAWSRVSGIRNSVKQAMVFDLLTYLAENLFTKVDRATMLCSVEARAPFVDREVMEIALRQPVRDNVGSVRTKVALKLAALERLPKSVVYRRKRGLSVPVASWINESLRDEFNRLLDPERLARQELLDPVPIGRLLEEHRDGRANHARRLWPLFTLQRWYERWIERPVADWAFAGCAEVGRTGAGAAAAISGPGNPGGG